MPPKTYSASPLRWYAAGLGIID